MGSDEAMFAVVDKLLKDANVPAAEEIVGRDKADEFRREVAQQLIVIGAAAQEPDTGGAKVLVSDRVSIRLGGTVWPLLTCVVTFVIAPLDPTGGALTYGVAGGAVVNALKEIGKVIHKLDPGQRVVCRAVVEVIKEKKVNRNEPEASADDLRSYFKKNEEVVPPKLDDILGDLVKAEVLRKIDYPTTGTYYRVRF